MRAARPAAREQRRREALGVLERLDERAEGGAGARVAVGDRAPDLGVREACGAPHHAVQELGGARASGGVEVEPHHLHQPILPRAQAAEVVRQLLGQHGDHAIGEVDARAARPGLAIDAAPSSRT